MIDIDPLLAETAEAPPCGPDLAYDAAFIELEQLARGKAEDQIGATVREAEPPPWPAVQKLAVALLGRSKDVRAATLLVRSLVHTEGFAGLAPGLVFMHGLLDRYWDAVHPLLDADDGNDPTMRLNALAPLADPLGLVKELRDTPLVRSRQLGAVLVRDVEIALGKLPTRTGVTAMPQAQIEAMLGAMVAEDPNTVPSVAKAVAAVRALSALLVAKVGSAQAPDFKPLLATLDALAQVVPEPVVAGAAAESEAGEGATPTPAAAKAASGEIRSRQDALSMIDRIIDYLERNEPTNPAPMLLRRGKRFMSMSFVDIVKEISPDSMAKIDVIAGPREGA